MNARMSFLFAATWFCLVAASCANDTQTAKEPPMNIQITSTAFADGQPIPVKYTCAGPNVSPPLQWANAPAGTKSFALIADDPDAPMGTWVHWVIYDLPPATTSLAENLPAVAGTSGRLETGCQRFPPDRLRRSLPAARQAAPLLFQNLRARHDARFEIRRDQEGIAQGDGWPCSGARPADGHVSTA